MTYAYDIHTPENYAQVQLDEPHGAPGHVVRPRGRRGQDQSGQISKFKDKDFVGGERGERETERETVRERQTEREGREREKRERESERESSEKTWR
eukprot:1384318-Amorphochlora_amoeboformis.AAC.1